jgi:hypothetical protein
MLPFVSYGQNGANEILIAPNSNSPHILVDTLFTLEQDISVGYTEIYLHYANPTPSDIFSAVQFRIFYDDVKFTTPEIYWGPTATPITDKYGSYFANSDYVNVIASYTGTNSGFDWADGAMFKLRLYHTTAYDGVVDSIAVAGSTTYNNLATTTSGLDVPLEMYNYGGNFQMDNLEFPIIARNADGTPAQGMWFTAQKRLKSDVSGLWTAIGTDSTDSNGLFVVQDQLDTAFWNLRITAQSDTMSDGSALSITDAYKLANHASQQDTLSGIEWYAGDVNESNDVTISDAFAMFNRLALQSTTWTSLFSGVNNVAILWPTEWNTANSATASPTWTTTPRVYSIDTIVNSMDSLKPYIYVVGDATTTGYNNPGVLVAKMADPGIGTDYILDPAVYLSSKPDTVEFRIPRLTMTADNKMSVPVTLYTFGNQLGAVQMGIEFDTAIFRFESIEMGDATSKWTSVLSVEKGKVFWAGHEDKMNPAVINDMTTQFTFNFEVIDPLGWNTSPLRIVDKMAGDMYANDVSISPSPNDGSVVNRTSIDPELNEMMNGFKVYPNPTTAYIGHWIVFEYHTYLEEGDINAIVYDINGREAMRWSDKIYQSGFQFQGFTMENLPNGMYLVRLVTPDRDKVYRIIKK